MKTQEQVLEALETIVASAKEQKCSYIAFAEKELLPIYSPETGKYEDIKDEMNRLMYDQIIELLSVLSVQGDSGMSIGYKAKILNKLILFETLNPMMSFKEEDFKDVGTGTRQSKISSAVFKEGDKFKYIDSCVFQPLYTLRDNAREIETNELRGWDTYRTSTQIVLMPDGTFCKYNFHYIKDTEKFERKQFVIPVVQMEHPKDWWTSVIRYVDLKDYLEHYELVYLGKVDWKREGQNYKWEVIEGFDEEELKEGIHMLLKKYDKKN